MIARPTDLHAEPRSKMLVELDRYISFHFGMAASAFPASLIGALIEELPSVEALRDPAWRPKIMRRLSIN